MATNKLNSKFCETAPAGTHFDGEGLYLLVRPDGKRYWHMACYLHGKRKLLSFGAYPKVSLEKARKARKDAQELLDQGVDPVQQKKEKKQAHIQAIEKSAKDAGCTFEQIATRLHKAKAGKTSDESRNKMLRQLEIHVFPLVGHKHIMDIKGAELLELFRKVALKTNHGRPMTYMAKRLCQWCGEVFDFASVENNDFSNDPCRVIIKHLPTHTTQHMARIRFQELSKFLQALEAYNGHELTKAAIMMLLYTGMRQASIRRAQWQDFDMNAAVWYRQPEKTDKNVHAVPLPKQALALLEKIKPLTLGQPDALALPSTRSPYNPMSEASICQALERMEFRMVGHGIRGVVSTGLNELGYPPHLVELQLGHKNPNKVEAAYNKAEMLDERRKMMQGWGDYLDGVAMKWNSTLEADLAIANAVEELALIVSDQIRQYAISLAMHKPDISSLEERSNIYNCSEFVRYHFSKCIYSYTEYLKEYDNICRYIVEKHSEKQSDKSFVQLDIGYNLSYLLDTTLASFLSVLHDKFRAQIKRAFSGFKITKVQTAMLTELRNFIIHPELAVPSGIGQSENIVLYNINDAGGVLPI